MEAIYDMKIQNNLAIIAIWRGIYVYKLYDIKIDNTSNRICRNKRLKEYCISCFFLKLYLKIIIFKTLSSFINEGQVSGRNYHTKTGTILYAFVS
jgi:hypothetical protein